MAGLRSLWTKPAQKCQTLMAYTCDSTGVKPIISAVEKREVMAVPTPPGGFPRQVLPLLVVLPL
jgi:hypothetical protein